MALLVIVLHILGDYFLYKMIRVEKVKGLLGFIFRNPSNIAFILFVVMCLIINDMVSEDRVVQIGSISSLSYMLLMIVFIPFFLIMKMSKKRIVNEDKSVTIDNPKKKLYKVFGLLYVAYIVLLTIGSTQIDKGINYYQEINKKEK